MKRSRARPGEHKSPEDTKVHVHKMSVTMPVSGKCPITGSLSVVYSKDAAIVAVADGRVGAVRVRLKLSNCFSPEVTLEGSEGCISRETNGHHSSKMPDLVPQWHYPEEVGCLVVLRPTLL